MIIQNSTPPVAFEKHYQVFKTVEQHLKEHLAGLQHEYFIAGLRVAYDDADSANEPGVLPYTIEFGYLGPVDQALGKTGKDITEDELSIEMQKSLIPKQLLDDLYARASTGLKEAANGKSLNVGVHVVLTGSPVEAYGITCTCYLRKKQYCCYSMFSRTTNCYCTLYPC